MPANMAILTDTTNFIRLNVFQNDTNEHNCFLSGSVKHASNVPENPSSTYSCYKEVGKILFVTGMSLLASYGVYYACAGTALMEKPADNALDIRESSRHNGGVAYTTTRNPTENNLNKWQNMHLAAQKQFGDPAPRERLIREISANPNHDIYYREMGYYVKSHNGMKTSVMDGLRELDKIADSIKNAKISRDIKKQLRVDLGLDRAFSGNSEARHNVGLGLEKGKTRFVPGKETAQQFIDNEKVKEWLDNIRENQKIPG